MQKKPIYIDDIWHTLVQWLITVNFRLSYRRLRYVGVERIPRDGAVILAPNHCNGLCDALALVAMDSRRKVFAARADMFRHPVLARWLRFHRIMPIRRVRDGLSEVRRNDETIHEAVDTLLHDTFFCIMPEGTHRTKHSLLPLSKGIFRIALETCRQTSRPVYIVPMGLEYGDYFRLYDSLLVQVGEPICISQVLADYPSLTEPQMLLLLRDMLTERMKPLFLYVPDDEHYEEAWQQLRTHMPAPWSEMQSHLWPRTWRVALLALTAPFAAVLAVMTLPYGLAAILVRHLVKDPDFYNSVQVFVQLILMVLTLGIGSLLWRLLSEWVWQLRHIHD